MNRHSLLTFCISIAFMTGCEEQEPIDEKSAPATPSEENVVSLKPAALQHMILRTQPAMRGKLEKTLRVAGRISENLNKTAKITSTFEGRLVKLNFDLDDRVKAGDVLAVVMSPELLNKPLELKSPIAGVVIRRQATVGELADKSKEIYTISDPADLWVIAEIKELDIGAVKVGQKATFKVLSYPDENFQGLVERIGNRIDPETRTMEVRIAVANAEGHLMPGMFADIGISTIIREGILQIPKQAILRDGDNQIVFVARDDHTFEKRILQQGDESCGRVQVLAGVNEGENVVYEGAFILKSKLLEGELGEKD